MLVLTRKKEEKLYIGNNITLTVLKVKGNSVQIGVEAPRDVRVLRSELAFEDNQPQKDTKQKQSAGVNRLRELAAGVKQETTVVPVTVQLV